jgi:hypothetical protein
MKHQTWISARPLINRLRFIFITQTTKRAAMAFLPDPHRYPNHIKPMEEEYGC